MYKLQAERSSSASHSQLHHSQPFIISKQLVCDWHITLNKLFQQKKVKSIKPLAELIFRGLAIEPVGG